MLILIAVFFVCSGIGIAIHIATDLTTHKQSMKIMNAVWILSALWGSYLTLWAYHSFGRAKRNDNSMDKNMSMNMPMDVENDSMKMDMNHQMHMDNNSQMSENMNMKMMDMDMEKKRPHWQSIALSALHCGAGCTLADIIGDFLSKFIHFNIAGSTLLSNWIIDFILALLIGVYFQFYAIREMEKISIIKGLIRAFKADVFSLTSWQIGMYGWMAIVYFVIFNQYPLEESRWIFWFMMQIAMLFGFLCAYPMNAILIKMGIKKGM